MPRVLITPTQLHELQGPYINLLNDAGLEIVTPPAPWDHQLSEAELMVALKNVAATVAGSEPYTERVLQAHPQLKVIARVGVGYDAVDVPAATAHGVAVAISPGANHDTVAEHAFSLLLALTKHVTLADREMREGKWIRRITIPLRGQTLGIVGLGRIGKAMAQRGIAFGMKVIAHDVQPNDSFCQTHGIAVVELNDLFRRADVISLHAPMFSATLNMLYDSTLALMYPTAYLLNTARGGLIDEAALFEALKNNKIAGAGLDVFAEEPPSQNHPFFALPNVVMTPHTAGTDSKSLLDMAALAAKAIVELAQGRWPAEQMINQEVRSRFTWIA